jgi:hypothetical protein
MQIAEKIRQDLTKKYILIQNQLLSANLNIEELIEPILLGSDSKQKPGKKQAASQILSSTHDFELPTYDIILMQPLLSHSLTANSSLENTFTFKGTFHLSAYLPVTPSTTLGELISLLQKDVSL